MTHCGVFLGQFQSDLQGRIQQWTQTVSQSGGGPQVCHSLCSSVWDLGLLPTSDPAAWAAWDLQALLALHHCLSGLHLLGGLLLHLGYVPTTTSRHHWVCSGWVVDFTTK